MKSQNTTKATRAKPMGRSFFRLNKSTIIYLGPIPRPSPPSSSSGTPFEIPYPSPSIIVYKKPTATKTPKNSISLTIPTETPWNIGGLGKILL
ncbi:12231_t:CDS:2 [Cetraspora pellucida]|uniref:12231_t:CDS:1 n=1 Tax=Cetraspora pellucida TaxID=1433469 RepID=A0A9N9GFV7_9GLOM|nr:12231_t:CDS:2 [Cetraspora pellucida]